MKKLPKLRFVPNDLIEELVEHGLLEACENVTAQQLLDWFKTAHKLTGWVELWKYEDLRTDGTYSWYVYEELWMGDGTVWMCDGTDFKTQHDAEIALITYLVNHITQELNTDE